MFQKQALKSSRDYPSERKLTPAQMVEETYKRVIRLESKLHALAMAQGIDLNQQLDQEFLKEK